MLSTTLLEAACMVDAVLGGTHELTVDGLSQLRDVLDQAAAMARLLEMDRTADTPLPIVPPGSNIVPLRPNQGGHHGAR